MLIFILSVLFFVINFISLLPFQHWVFRVPEFAKVQITTLSLVLLLFLLFTFSVHTINIVSFILLFCILVYNGYQLLPFLPLPYFKHKKPKGQLSKEISVISCNVLQYNENKDSFIKLILSEQPDIFLTLESDEKWEKSFHVFNENYPHQIKKPLSNTYGIHFYSKIPVIEGGIFYEISDDIPSVQALLETQDGYQFKFYGLHPPPPSPTEEETSKERDGELMKIAKKIKTKQEETVFVCGDFNNVAWAKSSRLFRTASGLIDPRHGRGLISTFHAKYKLLRFPIDLCFHSSNIQVNIFKALKNIHSDHLPLFIGFQLSKNETQNNKQLDPSQQEEVEDLIKEGEKTKGDR